MPGHAVLDHLKRYVQLTQVDAAQDAPVAVALLPIDAHGLAENFIGQRSTRFRPTGLSLLGRVDACKPDFVLRPVE
jgi:hypothetical protein